MVQTSICCGGSGTFHVSDITRLTSRLLTRTVRSLQTLLEDYKVWRVTVLRQKWVSTPPTSVPFCHVDFHVFRQQVPCNGATYS